jgi:hypothetical protein
MFDKLEPESMTSLYTPTITQLEETAYNINEQRQSSIVTPEINFQKSVNKQKCMQIYAPDNKSLAKERLENYRDLIDTKIKQLVLIQSNDCYCDWLQFGRSYNLDLISKEEYRHTPIMITNIFYKDGSERATKHVGKSLMVEYYPDSSDTCSSCKFYKDKTCTIHYVARQEKSKCEDYTSIS